MADNRIKRLFPHPRSVSRLLRWNTVKRKNGEYGGLGICVACMQNGNGIKLSENSKLSNRRWR
ncbi:unnamed protein product, partial [Citrullus colocynthis]